MHNFIQDYMVSTQYFAPRGKERLLFLGEQISHRHINFNDLLIGVVGDAGAGKSSLINEDFPAPASPTTPISKSLKLMCL